MPKQAIKLGAVDRILPLAVSQAQSLDMQAGDGKGGPMSMQTKERAVPNGVILEMTGDLTYANREHFKTAVEAVRQRGCRHLILSMADVRFVDSSGLGLLALVAQEFKLAQGIVSMLKPQSYVREIMSLANIPKLIPLYDNEQDAVAGYRQAA